MPPPQGGGGGGTPLILEPITYKATDCKGKEHEADSPAAAKALADEVECPPPTSVSVPVHSSFVQDEDIRDGVCDSTDPTCGLDGTADSIGPGSSSSQAERRCPDGTWVRVTSQVGQADANSQALAARCPGG